MYPIRREPGKESAKMRDMADGGDSDEALMTRYSRGDVRAFEMLYHRHELRVWRYIYRSVCNQASADEILQEVWLALIRSSARYVPTARFTTWLFTLAHHEIVNRFRRTKSDHSSDGLTELAAAAVDEPSRRAQSSQHAEALIAAVEQLPIEQREVFLLHAEGEMSLEEIATATAASYETVKSRLRYARSKLRLLLQEHV
jgi:RNA polymerase sigma factor (sigma-70 family)